MNSTSLNAAASASELVARTRSSERDALADRSDCGASAAISSATFGSCAQSTTSLPQRAATAAIAVPNEPAPMIEIFMALCARPSAAPSPAPAARCWSDA